MNELDIIFTKFFVLCIALMIVFVAGNIYIQNSKIELAKNSVYAYCTEIYKDFETHGNHIGFIDHCIEKNK